MSPNHLIIGSGGPTGECLRKHLQSKRATVYNTSHRPLPSPMTTGHIHWISLDLFSPEEGLKDLGRAFSGEKKFGSMTIFSHPTLSRKTDPLSVRDPLDFFPALTGIKKLLDCCLPFLEDGVILAVQPCMTLLKASGYLNARVYFGGMRGLLEEYSRAIPAETTCFLTLELAHIPDGSTPQIPPAVMERMERQTIGGFPDPDSLARTIMDLTAFQRPWMQGKTLRFPDSAFF